MVIRKNYEELSSALQVRAPLLMLDSLDLDTDTRSAVGVKAVSMNESVFQGHFPGAPVVPGVLQVAGMAQVAQMLFEQCFPGEGQPWLKALRRVKFRTPVQPAMMLKLSCEVGAENADGSVEFLVKNTAEDGALCSSGTVCLERRPKEFFCPAPATGECPFQAELATEQKYTSIQLMEYIPHRYPFMLLDCAYGLKMASSYGVKNVTGGDPLVSASSPACYPGYLQIEAGAQLGCAAMLSQPENQGLLGFFMSIDEAEFLRPVQPGERLVFHACCEPKGRFGIANGIFAVGNETVTTGSIKFALVPREQAEK